MKRRTFVAAIGGALAWPVVSTAQQSSGVHHVGVLVGGTKNDAQTRAGLEAFNKGLAERGWIEGRTFTLRTDGLMGSSAGCKLSQKNWSLYLLICSSA